MVEGKNMGKTYIKPWKILEIVNLHESTKIVSK